MGKKLHFMPKVVKSNNAVKNFNAEVFLLSAKLGSFHRQC